MSWKTLIIGIFVRVWLFRTRLGEVLVDRVEITTPITSWKRVTEGIHLWLEQGKPYEGDLFHGSPLTLWFFTFLDARVPHTYRDSVTAAVFIVFDVLTAVLLAKASQQFLRNLVVQQKTLKVHESSSHLLVKADENESIYHTVLAAYLLNPYTTLTCAAKAITAFNNVFLALSLLCIARRRFALGLVTVALSSYQDLYPLMLIVPLSLCTVTDLSLAGFAKSILKGLACFAFLIAVLFGISFHWLKDWRFLQSTYGTILTVPDLTPNIGLFWYFFTEMFDHFYSFFTCVFQINAFVYVLPLALRFDRNIPLLTFTLCALMAIFKSYPAVGDVAFYLALLPLWKHLLPFMRHSFIVACIISATSILGPIVWQLWIYSGSANANFFFAMTLAFATAQIFLVTDLLFAQVKYEYHLKNGMDLKLNGKPAFLVLE